MLLSTPGFFFLMRGRNYKNKALSLHLGRDVQRSVDRVGKTLGQSDRAQIFTPPPRESFGPASPDSRGGVMDDIYFSIKI